MNSAVALVVVDRQSGVALRVTTDTAGGQLAGRSVGAGEETIANGMFFHDLTNDVAYR